MVPVWRYTTWLSSYGGYGYTTSLCGPAVESDTSEGSAVCRNSGVPYQALWRCRYFPVCPLLSEMQKMKSYYPALKASGRDSILKEPSPSSNSISNKIRTEDKLSDNQRCLFCGIPQEEWANNPLEDKAPITSTKCKSL